MRILKGNILVYGIVILLTESICFGYVFFKYQLTEQFANTMAFSSLVILFWVATLFLWSILRNFVRTHEKLYSFWEKLLYFLFEILIYSGSPYVLLKIFIFLAKPIGNNGDLGYGGYLCMGWFIPLGVIFFCWAAVDFLRGLIKKHEMINKEGFLMGKRKILFSVPTVVITGYLLFTLLYVSIFLLLGIYPLWPAW